MYKQRQDAGSAFAWISILLEDGLSMVSLGYLKLLKHQPLQSLLIGQVEYTEDRLLGKRIGSLSTQTKSIIVYYPLAVGLEEIRQQHDSHYMVLMLLDSGTLVAVEWISVSEMVRRKMNISNKTPTFLRFLELVMVSTF